MARVVITGGAGFIGSHLCESFLERGDEVLCIDNFSTGAQENVSDLLSHPRFRLVEQDVTCFMRVEGPVDMVLHFASPASPADYQELPIQTLKVGSLGTHNALGLAKAKNALFLLASTSEVYGDPLVKPQREDYWGNVNPLGPRGVYDEAKRFAEALTMAYHRHHGLNTRIARIFNTYGPRMRMNDGRVVPNFIHQALTKAEITVYGNGSQTRSFLYIDDLVRGLHRLWETRYHLPINLGSAEERTILDFAKKILEITGSTSAVGFRPLPEDDPRMRQPDISRAREVLGWEPGISLEQGLTKTIGYFQERLRAGPV